MTDQRTRALERRYALTQARELAEAWLRALSRGGGDPDQVLRARHALGLIDHDRILRLALLGYAPARRFLDWKPQLWGAIAAELLPSVLGESATPSEA